MLDVHGVTGSSPVPRTIVKSPETIMVLGFFVILPKSFVVMVWKMPAKVAEIGFCGFCRSKKTGGLLNWGGRLFCVLELFFKYPRNISYLKATKYPIALVSSAFFSA